MKNIYFFVALMVFSSQSVLCMNGSETDTKQTIPPKKTPAAESRKKKTSALERLHNMYLDQSGAFYYRESKRTESSTEKKSSRKPSPS
ncbi:MAG: hypothetical protein HYX35_05075 [Proteobacteria bacterium]|nr:hypothetical protein [Pseudomonadota bacterium]